jgi:hypothetical protein
MNILVDTRPGMLKTSAVAAACLTLMSFLVGCGGGPGSVNNSSRINAITPPKLTGILPASGPTTGGTTVAITGTDIQKGATVVFGNVPAAKINSVTSTSIEAVTPVHDPGKVDVKVTNPDTGSDTLLGAFTFEGSPPPLGGPPPTISSVLPNSGPVIGGTVVTITGTDFQSGATVTFGQTPATAVVFNNATQLQATTPTHAEGSVDVIVRNPDGQSATAPSGFTYQPVPAPTIIGLLPTSGPEVGGTLVTITGTNFLAGATVSFGGVAAASVTVASSTQIQAVTPPHATGAVDVRVTNPDAQFATLPAGFTYGFPPPTISSIVPSTGPTAGGTAVTITGTGFQAGATVSLGGAAAASVAVASSTQIQAVTPPHATGPVDVRVTNPDAQFATLPADFTYGFPPPTISSIVPSTGPTAGGTAVTITGTGFQAGATVSLGGDAATGVNVLSATQIQAVTPAHAAGTVDVTVQNPDAQSATLTSGFSYAVTPLTISNISPSSGLPAGGTVVTITGTNFQPGATVTFGGAPATAVTVVSATQIDATTPAHAAGPVDVKVTNPDGGSTTVTSGFAYGTVTIGCGADCGNVGDPYEGGSPAPDPTNVSACGTLTPTGSPTQYLVTQDIGADPSAVCLSTYYPPGSFVLDLGGHTVTGQINIETNHLSGSKISNGTVNCSITDATESCIHAYTSEVPSAQARLHHLTVYNSATDERDIHVGWQPSSNPLTGATKALRLDHITGTVPSQPTSYRNYIISIDGGGQASFEVDHCNLTCPFDSAACQGIMFYHAPYSYAHHNLITLEEQVGTTGTPRGILFDSVGKTLPATGGEAAFNEILPNANRGIRVRSNVDVNIHDNLFRRITAAARIGAIHLGENDTTIETQNTSIHDNIFELEDGLAVYAADVNGVTVSNNAVQCYLGTCGTNARLGKTDNLHDYAGTVDVYWKNNTTTGLTTAIFVCGTGECVDPAATTSSIVCNSGTTTGSGNITVLTPPCP